MEEQAIVKIEVSIDGANLILTALAERAEKLERGALKTSNAFFAEFAAERGKRYEALHDNILRQLIAANMEPVEGRHVNREGMVGPVLQIGLASAT